MTIALCPIHAEAAAAIDLLRRLVEQTDRVACPICGALAMNCYEWCVVRQARPLLAAIDGASAPAERGQ